jgi:hypothetical protein
MDKAEQSSGFVTTGVAQNHSKVFVIAIAG